MNRKLGRFTTAALAAVLLAGCDPVKEAPQSKYDIAQTDTVTSEKDTESISSDGTTDDVPTDIMGVIPEPKPEPKPEPDPEDGFVEMGEVPVPEAEDELVTEDDIKS